MARVVTPGEARQLGLPGRASAEIIAGDVGARQVTVRLVEIAVPRPGDPRRGRHVHHGFEECIHVVEGEGTTHSGDGVHQVRAGDTILIPPDEPHVTRNTGRGPLKLLCFFPVADIRPGTEDLPLED